MTWPTWFAQGAAWAVFGIGVGLVLFAAGWSLQHGLNRILRARGWWPVFFEWFRKDYAPKRWPRRDDAR